MRLALSLNSEDLVFCCCCAGACCDGGGGGGEATTSIIFTDSTSALSVKQLLR